MPHDIFISHEAGDRTAAEAACEAIERAGHLCCYDASDIESCKIFLLILSAESVASVRVLREAERAAGAGLAIVPFRIEAVEPSPELAFLIGGAPMLDALQPPLGPHLDHLTAIVGRLLEGGEGAPPRPLTAPPMPLPRLPRTAPSWLPIALAGLIGLIAIAIVAATMGSR